MKGRIGDSPLVGNGTYATDSVGAVSCTGKIKLADNQIFFFLFII